jgi:hypothetical protein
LSLCACAFRHHSKSTAFMTRAALRRALCKQLRKTLDGGRSVNPAGSTRPELSPQPPSRLQCRQSRRVPEPLTPIEGVPPPAERDVRRAD